MAPFRDSLIFASSSSRRWECGNRLYRFPELVGRAENSTIVFRAFHKPSFPRSISTEAPGLRRFSYLLEHVVFGLLHASRSFRIAHRSGHALERGDGQSGAQKLLRVVERKQRFQRRAPLLVDGALLVYLDFGLGRGAVVVDVGVEEAGIKLVERCGVGRAEALLSNAR